MISHLKLLYANEDSILYSQTLIQANISHIISIHIDFSALTVWITDMMSSAQNEDINHMSAI